MGWAKAIDSTAKVEVRRLRQQCAGASVQNPRDRRYSRVRLHAGRGCLRARISGTRVHTGAQLLVVSCFVEVDRCSWGRHGDATNHVLRRRFNYLDAVMLRQTGWARHAGLLRQKKRNQYAQRRFPCFHCQGSHAQPDGLDRLLAATSATRRMLTSHDSRR